MVDSWKARPPQCIASMPLLWPAVSFYFLKSRQGSGLSSLSSQGGQVYAAMQRLVRSVQFPKLASDVREKNIFGKYGTVYAYPRISIGTYYHIWSGNQASLEVY